MKVIKTFADLRGHTLTEIVNKSDEILFTLDDGRRFKLYHCQSCCESVTV